MELNKDIQDAVATIAEEKAQLVSVELKTAQESFEAKNTELNTQIEEVKNLTADLEAKLAAQTVETKEVSTEFDVKSANVALKAAMTGDKAVEIKALTIAGGEALGIDNELGRTVIERARENVAILGAVGSKSVGSVNYRELVLRTYPATAETGENTTLAGADWSATATQTYVEVVMKVGKQYCKPQITDEAVSDPHIDIFAHLESLLAEEVGRYWAQQVLAGNGSANQIKGILTNAVGAAASLGHMDTRDPSVAEEGVLGESWKDNATRDPEIFPVVPSGVLGAFPATSLAFMDKLIDITAALPSNYLNNASWTMNRRTLASIRKLRDTQERPLVQFEGGAFNLIGYPIILEDYMPNAAQDAFPIIFGDLEKAYKLINIDETYLIDPYSVDGAVQLKSTTRKGSLIGNNDAIVVFQTTDADGLV